MSARAILVEDDELVRRSTEALLQHAGYEVNSFTSGDELLEHGVPQHTGVILLDMRLPGASGLDVLRELNRRRNEVPVILITAHADVALAVEAMKLGAADFIEKPYSLEQLAGVISRARLVVRANSPTTSDNAEAMGKIAQLTERQRDVLKRMARGDSNKKIANSLAISVRTVEAYRAQMMRRLGIRNSAGAVRIAMLGGLLDESEIGTP